MNNVKKIAVVACVIAAMTGFTQAAKHHSKPDATLRLSTGGFALGIGVSWGSGTLTYKTEAHCPLRKTTVHGRDVIRIEGPDKVVMESYMNEGGKEVKMMELVSVRK